MDVKIIQEIKSGETCYTKKVIIDGTDISKIVSKVNVDMSGSDPTVATISLSAIADYEITIQAEDIILRSVHIPESFKKKIYENLKEYFKKKGERK